jgi:hypothetical protein
MMKWMCYLFLLTSAFAVFAPAFAEDAAITLPGSAIVFPKFIRGSVVVDGAAVPTTEILVSADCPLFSGDVTCSDDEQVRVRAHWVCPGSQSLGSKLICNETDFEFTIPLNGTAVFNPEGIVVSGSNPVFVPMAPCPRGYLIAWVIDEFGQPIKFDALFGWATLRESGSAFSNYVATVILADQDWPPPRKPLLLGPGGALVFDNAPGHLAPGHYDELNSRVRQNFPFAQSPLLGPVPPGGFRTTFITLLTLDVRSNRPNLPTFVPFAFFNQDGSRTGTSTEFVCWTEQRVDAINPNLTFEEMGTRWGLAFSGQAVKFPWAGISDTPGPATLLGLMEVREGPMTPTAMRTVLFGLSPVHSPTPTSFLP